MTETRASLYVPSSPETAMSLGKAWSARDWNADGFSVSTEGRIWLDANGDDASSSTLTLRSNGSGSDGQLLLQSLRANLYIFAKSRTVVSSDRSVLIAGGKGVRLMGGHGTVYGFGLPWGGVWKIVDDTTLDRVGPDESDPKSKHAEGTIDRMETLSDIWSICSAAYTLTALVPELWRLGMGVRGVGSSANTMTALAAMGFAADQVRGAVQLGKIGGQDEVPGLQIHAYGSVNLCTTGFASITSGAGLHVDGAISTDFLGGLTAGAFGGLGAHLKALTSYDVSGSRCEVTAGGSLYVGATTWRTEHHGLTVTYGQIIPTWPTQVPTTTIDIESLIIDALVTAGSIDILTTGEVRVNGTASTTIEAPGGVKLSSPGYEISVSYQGVRMSCAATTAVAIDATGSTFTADNGSMKTVVDRMGVTVSDAAGACKLEVLPTGCALKGPLVTFL